MRLSSALRAVDLAQDPPPLIIGERLNTQGSKLAKKLTIENDLDGLLDIARDQVSDGAHCLDVCVATTELSNEKEVMTDLVKRLSLEIDAPLVIDSTDPDVIESAVVQIPGKPMINSINLEGDGGRFARLAPIMARYGVPAIAMCIGPAGMAKTPQEKLDTARLLLDEGKKYGLGPDHFVFDVLTFTLGTGEVEFEGAGKHTLEGIRLVKRNIPGCHTVLGLSNVSFGLDPAARRIINSVFLYHAVRAGLDAAIVNYRGIVPYADITPAERRLAEDLIFNRRADALPDIISHFAGSAAGGSAKREEVDPSWPAGKRVHYRIVNRLKDGMGPDVTSAISERAGSDLGSVSPEVAHDAAIKTLNEDLLPAMKEVGDRFGAGDLILPFVLRSAECMKAAVSIVERYLLRDEGSSKGKLVLGTVYGDVHDIGKNLVKTIFENNGYTVYDLGKQVPMQKFLDKIKEVDADAVGLSALLVSTSRQMQFFVEHARQNGLEIPVLCGGAAINTNYINRIAKADGVYEPGVFYCRTMFEGLKTMDRLMTDRNGLLSEWRERLERWHDHSGAARPAELPRSGVVPALPPNLPSKRLHRLSSEIDVDQVWKMIDKKSLFKLSWGLSGRAGAKHEQSHEKLFEEWKRRIAAEDLFEPSAVYGFFRCRSDGNALVVGGEQGEVRFEFPRSTQPKHLCLADYFGLDDVVALQAVTAGSRASGYISRWDAEDRYADSYYLNGLAVEFAEGLAAWVNKRIRSELGLSQGCLRYSWGYPSCPDVLQHRLVWQLLRPEASGMTLTESGQIVPEQSTAAIIVHHPEAEYFVL